MNNNTFMRISRKNLDDLKELKRYKLQGHKIVLESYTDVIQRLIDKHKDESGKGVNVNE